VIAVHGLQAMGAQNPLGGDRRREEIHALTRRQLWDLRNGGGALGKTRNTPEAKKPWSQRTPDRVASPLGWREAVESYRDTEVSPEALTRWISTSSRASRSKAETVTRKAYQLRDMSRPEHPMRRCADCGYRPIGEVALMRREDGGHTIGGVLTCGSVWSCPVCALKIKASRAEEIKQGAELHRKHHGPESMMMLSLTLRHDDSMSLRELRDGLQAAHNDFWRLVPQMWKDMRIKGTWKEHHGFIGYVSGTEVTHGSNGWHPHRHYLLAFDDSKDGETVKQLREVFMDHWRRCVVKHLGMRCLPSKHGLDLRPLRLAEYLSKLGLEISDVGVKEAKCGNQTPWGLLAEMAEGSGIALDKFAEYSSAMKGAKCVQFSEDLKSHWERLGAPQAECEADLADDSIGAVMVFEMTRAQWFKLRNTGRVRDFLDRCDGGELPMFPENQAPGWGDQERAIEQAERPPPLRNRHPMRDVWREPWR